ncbi:class I SAM-dependent methyltransferase [Roseibium sp. FZY0029]|uniref:class I SAM-dependent methyltransferase n=1 Tax=Roseibium sp. FZY0029 TaxID=3116647 RepID=UPI002ECAB877|nr:class I SAM-dependent methyltransferase [Roseibium sp. FZY0029]
MYSDVRGSLENAVNTYGRAIHGEAHLLTMYNEIAARERPTVLELGTREGISTRAFLGAIHEGDGGHLYSVDIVDCSSVANSPRWTFIQSDSADIEGVLSKAPNLRNGIDVLYIDSVHEVEHVKKELFGYFPFVKPGGVIFFDDVDSLPYMLGRQKDNIHTEIGNRMILTLLNEVFEDNEDTLYFCLSRGSTGLARLEKRSALGEKLATQQQPRARYSKRYWKMRRSFLKRLHTFFPSSRV